MGTIYPRVVSTYLDKQYRKIEKRRLRKIKKSKCVDLTEVI